jgi:hypothetical protein
MIKKELIDLITAKRAQVGVIGLGYVGLPLLAEFAGSGIKATGFEVDAEKAAQINSGNSYIGDVPSACCEETRRWQTAARHDRLRSSQRLRRDHHLRPDAPAQNKGAGCFLHPRGLRKRSRNACGAAVGYPRVNNLSGYYK